MQQFLLLVWGLKTFVEVLLEQLLKLLYMFMNYLESKINIISNFFTKSL